MWKNGRRLMCTLAPLENLELLAQDENSAPAASGIRLTSSLIFVGWKGRKINEARSFACEQTENNERRFWFRAVRGEIYAAARKSCGGIVWMVGVLKVLISKHWGNSVWERIIMYIRMCKTNLIVTYANGNANELDVDYDCVCQNDSRCKFCALNVWEARHKFNYTN